MKDKRIETLINEINGSCRPTMIAAVNGNLPKCWSVEHLEALPMLSDDPAAPPVVVLATAGTRLQSMSVRFEVGAIDKLKIADMVADLLTRKIASHRRAGEVDIALAPGAIMPKRATDGASGYDLYALSGMSRAPGMVMVIDTGVTIRMPPSMEAQIRPRSGLASRGIWGNLGTIDSDYRGSLKAILINHTTDTYQVKAGDSVAQLVFATVSHPTIVQVDAIAVDETARGSGGLGSTGR